MDLDTMLADAAPARHVALDGPGSPAAIGLYERIVAQPPAAHPARRSRFAVPALIGAVAATAAAIAAPVLPGSPGHARPGHGGGPPRTSLAAWSVARQPDGLVLVTIRELRDPGGLRRMLHADGVPANVRFVPHNFMATTSPSAIPRACRAPHLSNRANALLQGKITPPWPLLRPGASTGIARNSKPGVVLAIRPSAIPPGIGIYLAAWAARPGTGNGPYLTMQTNLVQVSPQCTGR
jgi:hypothetical protein